MVEGFVATLLAPCEWLVITSHLASVARFPKRASTRSMRGSCWLAIGFFHAKPLHHPACPPNPGSWQRSESAQAFWLWLRQSRNFGGTLKENSHMLVQRRRPPVTTVHREQAA